MLTFEEKGHEYRWNGKVVPSVTQIMGRVGVRTTVSSGREYWNSISGSEFISDEVAANFGTAFHTVAEAKLNGWGVGYDSSMDPWVNGFDKFISDNIDLITAKFDNELMIEKMLYSRRYGYPLTFDWLAIDQNTDQYYLVDWKTSTSMQKHWWIQLGACLLYTSPSPRDPE